MADLKTPYTDPAMGAPDLGGQGVIARGGDPLIDLAGSSGVMPIWGQDRPVMDFGPMETPNSISGLPSTPARWEPSESSEQPPDLTDRNPGTIDRR